jgi:hypothetical protein
MGNMRSKITIAAILLMSVFLIGNLTSYNLAQANFDHPPDLRINSPESNYSKLYYNTTTVSIDVSVVNLGLTSKSPVVSNPKVARISYSLDGKADVELSNIETSLAPMAGSMVSAHSTLSDLTEGNHTLSVKAFYVSGEVLATNKITFTVDITPPYPTPATPRPYNNPTLRILSPLNTTYTSREIQLAYTISGQIIWSYYYLDDKYPSADNHVKPKSFNGNITLANLSDGKHKILISVYTDIGSSNLATYFTVNSGGTGNASNSTSTQTPATSTNTTQLMSTVAFIATLTVIVAISLLLYRSHRSSKNLNSKSNL